MAIIDRLKSIKNVFKFGSSVSQNASRSIFWTFSHQISVQLVNLVKLAIIANILGPEKLGIVGIALLTQSLLTSLTATGTKSALIHQKGDISQLLNTGFTINFVRNMFLFVLMILLADPVSKIFNEPASKPFIVAVAVVLFIDAFSNIATVYFRKNLDFRKEFVLQMTGDLSNIFVTIAFAFILRSAWAIVLGMFTGHIIKLIVGYWLHPFMPKLDFNKERMFSILNYSVWIFISSIFGYLILEGDDAFLGIVLGATALGLYQMAYKIGNLPATKFSHVIAQVAMPTYAKFQTQPAKLEKTYIWVLKLTMTSTTLLVGMGIYLSPSIVRIIFGSEWLMMTLSMQILLLAGYFRALASTIGPVFLAMGIPKKDTIWQGIRLLVIVIFIGPLTFTYGMDGTSFTILLSIFIATFGFSYNILNLINLSLKEFLTAIVIPIFNIGSTIGLVVVFNQFVSITNIYIIAITGLIGTIAYGLGIFVTDYIFNYGFKDIIKTNLRNMLLD